MSRASMLRVVVLFVAGALAACQTTAQRIQHKEDRLDGASFVIRQATTAAQKAMLARLPANRIVKRVHGSVVHYVYADPVLCRCLYVGDEAALARYHGDDQRQEIAAVKRVKEDDYAYAYNDADWDWNAWGPWDTVPGFYAEPGLGW